MIKYIKYFKYIVEHKINIYKAGIKHNRGKYLKYCLFHDISKFNTKEFIPYARYFYGNYISNTVLNNVHNIKNKSKIKTKEDVKYDFNKALVHHYKHNKHHWQYWIGKDIPGKYIHQIIIDFMAMGIKFNNTAQEYYLKNYFNINLTYKSRLLLEQELNLNDSDICGYGHILFHFFKIYDKKTFYDSCNIKNINNKYNVDVYKIFDENKDKDMYLDNKIKK